MTVNLFNYFVINSLNRYEQFFMVSKNKLKIINTKQMKRKAFLLVAIVLISIFTCIYFNGNSEDRNNERFNNATTTIVKTHYTVNMDSILHVYKAMESKEDVSFFLNGLENYAEKLNQKFLAEKNHKKALVFEKYNAAFMKTKAGSIKKLHPEWSKQDCQKLADNYLWKGMHIEMVKYNRGNPDDVNVYRNGLTSEYEYVWKNEGISRFYTKKDGIVANYD
jgi:hypothetical protein